MIPELSAVSKSIYEAETADSALSQELQPVIMQHSLGAYQRLLEITRDY